MNLLFTAYAFGGVLLGFGVTITYLLVKILKKPVTIEHKNQILDFDSWTTTNKYPALRAKKSNNFDFCIIDFEKIRTGDDNFVDIFILFDKGTNKQFICNSYGGITER